MIKVQSRRRKRSVESDEQCNSAPVARLEKMKMVHMPRRECFSAAVTDTPGHGINFALTSPTPCGKRCRTEVVLPAAHRPSRPSHIEIASVKYCDRAKQDIIVNKARTYVLLGHPMGTIVQSTPHLLNVKTARTKDATTATTATTAAKCKRQLSPCALVDFTTKATSESVDSLFTFEPKRDDCATRGIKSGIGAHLASLCTTSCLQTPGVSGIRRVLPHVKCLGRGQYAYVFESAVSVNRADVFPVAVKMICERNSPVDDDRERSSNDATLSDDVWVYPETSHLKVFTKHDKEMAMREVRAGAVASVLRARQFCPTFPHIHYAHHVLTQTGTVVATCIVMDVARFGNMRDWIRGKDERTVATVYIQVLIALCAVGSVDLVHNDLYTRNVLMDKAEYGVHKYVMPGGRHVAVDTHGVVPMLSDWGMSTSIILGPLPEAHEVGVNDAHDMSHDFEVKSTLSEQDVMSLRASSHNKKIANAVKRRSSLRACIQHGPGCVHVMLAKDLPVWARDVVAISSSVHESMKQSGMRSPWMTAVMKSMCQRVINDKFVSPHSLCDFVNLITSETFGQDQGVDTSFANIFKAESNADMTTGVYDVGSLYQHTALQVEIVDMCSRPVRTLFS